MAELRGVRAHLRAVNQRGEVLIDADVNRVEVGFMVRWECWEPGQKDQADLHEVRMVDLAEVTLTPPSDRLKHAEVIDDSGITTHADGGQCTWDIQTQEHYRMHPLYPLTPCEQDHERTR